MRNMSPLCRCATNESGSTTDDDADDLGDDDGDDSTDASSLCALLCLRREGASIVGSDLLLGIGGIFVVEAEVIGSCCIRFA